MVSRQMIFSLLLICFLISNGNFQQIPLPEDLKYFDYLAKLSMASYCDIRTLFDWDCGAPCEEGFHLTRQENQSSLVTEIPGVEFAWSNQRTVGFVGRNLTENTIFIVFRGTIPNSIYNWQKNLDFTKIDTLYCEGCKVHKGFYESYYEVAPLIKKYLLGFLYNMTNPKVIVTGHSLGGAMATIFVADLFAIYNFKVNYFVTYGSPRVGDPIFSKWFNEIAPISNFRITHNHDIVPHVPKESLMGYLHVGTNVHYNSDSSSYQVCKSDCSVIATSVSDHSTYMGYNWDTMRERKCGYHKPTESLIPRPKYKAFVNDEESCLISEIDQWSQSEIIKCQGQKIKNKMYFCQCKQFQIEQNSQEEEIICDFFNPKTKNCYGAVMKPITESQCLKSFCGKQNCQQKEGYFCCLIEGAGKYSSSVQVKMIYNKTEFVQPICLANQFFLPNGVQEIDEDMGGNYFDQDIVIDDQNQ